MSGETFFFSLHPFPYLMMMLPLLFQPIMKEQKPFCLFTHFEQKALKLLCQHVLLSSAFSRKILFQPDHIYQNIKPTLKHGFAWSAVLRQIMTDSKTK